MVHSVLNNHLTTCFVKRYEIMIQKTAVEVLLLFWSKFRSVACSIPWRSDRIGLPGFYPSDQS